jgi:hypothetical protein
VKCADHNHDIIGFSAHAIHRRPSVAQLEEFERLSKAGVKPKRIATVLRKSDPTSAITVKGISNARNVIKNKHSNGRTSLQTLLDDLHQSDWEFSYHTNDEQQITRLFLIHPDSLKMARSYNHVAIGDYI